MNIELKTKVVVLGAGPAGYSAAFRCADLGLETILVERYPNIGGVCLNVGCIPSKSLLHIAKVIDEVNILSKYGIFEKKIDININNIRIWKERLVNQLVDSLKKMAEQRNINVVHGTGKFIDKNNLEIEFEKNKTIIYFENAIIAAGSSAIKLPFCNYQNKRIWNSSDALKLKNIPNNLLIIGAGIIGLELATIYHALGANIDIVEISDQVIPGIDKDIARTFIKCIDNKFNFMLKTRVITIEDKTKGIEVSLQSEENSHIEKKLYDGVLVAVGRYPNGKLIDAHKAEIKVNDNGFINVDNQMRTNIPHIFAVGDIVGNPMLAHKGMSEAHIAAEVISGMQHYFQPNVIPSIAYTEPEVAWVGITEKEAIKNNIKYEIATFPWSASGRAVASNCANGITKLIFEKKSNRIIGGAVVGSNGGELLGEICLAIEMGCESEDIALTIHAHPTLHESIKLASEIYEGTITDFPNITRNTLM